MTMRRVTIKRAVPVIVGLLGALGSAAVVADGTPQQPAGERALSVRYGDLDLGRDMDVQALYVRLRRAAKRVCDPVGSLDLHMLQVSRQCERRALDSAVIRSGSERLAALHFGTSREVAIARRGQPVQE
jgi:UrcA family protein